MRNEGSDAVVRKPSIVGAALRLAEEVLFPAALATDASPVVPVALLDALAEAGLYCLVGPREAGGLDADARTFALVSEALAGGCLTTTFVWAQHHSAVRTVRAARPAVRDAWLRSLCSGERSAGVAYASLRRPGAPLLVAQPSEGGWTIDGTAPWVTGWTRVDVVHVAARTGDGRIVWALVDASPSETLEVTPFHLAAVAASATVTLAFRAHRVDEERVTLVEGFDEWHRRDLAGLRPNGSLALGLARRCAAPYGLCSHPARPGKRRSRHHARGPRAAPRARGAVPPRVRSDGIDPFGPARALRARRRGPGTVVTPRGRPAAPGLRGWLVLERLAS